MMQNLIACLALKSLTFVLLTNIISPTNETSIDYKISCHKVDSTTLLFPSFCQLAMLKELGIQILYLTLTLIVVSSDQDSNFSFNGFQSSKNMNLDGVAEFTSNGILKLTNNDSLREIGHAFYSKQITFKKSSSTTSVDSSVSSFSTTFVFAIVSAYPGLLSGHGMAFVISPTKGLPKALPREYLGLFNDANDGNATNHVLAVELDTVQNEDKGDINDNHVGIDINGIKSNVSFKAGYYLDTDGEFQNLTLNSGLPMQVWVDYFGNEKQINVTLAPINVNKPKRPLLSLNYDLSPIINDEMFVGFSSATGKIGTFHYVLGWSFAVNGIAGLLDLSRIPKLPRVGPKKRSRFLTIELPLILITLLLLLVSGIVYYVMRKRKFAEVLEDWEHEYGPHRFKYKDLYVATKGFKEKELLGAGGFGRVYKGVLPYSKTEVAVKKVSHESRQGMREFIAEIVSIGRLRHRNIVPLLGYCRRKRELLLVYDYMPNGSLDKFLYEQPKSVLNWSQRFRIIKGVATGLNYLHQEWEQVVIHRDVKASNVLLDGEFNGRLGDFGLARLYDHGSNPQTTHIVGTIGYLAPEQARTGKATTSSDVFSFGAFMLEVVCGRRPIMVHSGPRNILLVDYVFSCLNRGAIFEAVDQILSDNYVPEEVELALKLGLLCSNSEPEGRPSMLQVIQYLEGHLPLPEVPSLGISSAGLKLENDQGFDDFVMSYPSSMDKQSTNTISVVESLLSGGR